MKNYSLFAVTFTGAASYTLATAPNSPFTAPQAILEVFTLPSAAATVNGYNYSAKAWGHYTSTIAGAVTFSATTGTLVFLYRVVEQKDSVRASCRAAHATLFGAASTVALNALAGFQVAEGTVLNQLYALNSGEENLTLGGSVCAPGAFVLLASCDPSQANLVRGSGPSDIYLFYGEAGDASVFDLESKLEDAVANTLSTVTLLDGLQFFTGLYEDFTEQKEGVLIQATHEEDGIIDPQWSGDFKLPLAVKLYSHRDQVSKDVHRARTAALRDVFMRKELPALLSGACERFSANGVKWRSIKQTASGRHWVSEIKMDVQCCGIDIPAS